ncbi:MAG: hypothetical protein MJ252_17850, partial [archaeon]|nr:hypothetical protein [archaeon]
MVNKFILLLSFFLFFSFCFCDGEIEATKYELDSSPKDLVWCGNNNEYTLLLTETNSVYRSDDKGMHWKKLNDIFINTGKDELEENENEIGKVSQILQSPADKTLLIFLGTHGINWIGEDCGHKIKALNQGRKINEFYFHPTERNWGLASAYSICEDFVGEPCRIFKEVYYTLDMGNNWKQIGSYVVQFGWGVADKSHIDKGVPKERIIMTYDPRGKGDQKNDGWSYKVDCVYSDNFFVTSKVLVSKGNKFLLTKDYLFVAQVVDQESQEVLLLGSKSNVKNYNLLPVEISRKSVLEHSYTFLDTTLDSVFLHINHFGEASPYGDVYTSGEKGIQYSISLRNNVRTKDSQCDFEKIYSVEGAYIGNAISYKYIKTVQKEIEGLIYDTSQSMGKDTTKKGGKKESKGKGDNTMAYNDYIKTLITSNKGGNWRR